MASIETTNTIFAGRGLNARIGRAVVATRAAIGDWARARNTRKQLSRLNDRELADIGLTRADIYRKF